jgi:hypothetical protein
MRSGNTLAEVILGKKARGRVGGAIADGQYVRLPGDQQSWLVRGVVEGTAELSTWVDNGVVEMNVDQGGAGRVQAERRRGTGGAPHRRDRGRAVQSSSSTTCRTDRTPKNDLTIRYAATDIANSRFTEVRKDQGGDVAWRTRLMMEDGMLIEFNITADDWMSVKVLEGGRDKETSERHHQPHRRLPVPAAGLQDQAVQADHGQPDRAEGLSRSAQGRIANI